jgi:hypothetical protein
MQLKIEHNQCFVLLKMAVLWDIAACSLVDDNSMSQETATLILITVRTLNLTYYVLLFVFESRSHPTKNN